MSKHKFAHLTLTMTACMVVRSWLELSKAQVKPLLPYLINACHQLCQDAQIPLCFVCFVQMDTCIGTEEKCPSMMAMLM